VDAITPTSSASGALENHRLMQWFGVTGSEKSLFAGGKLASKGSNATDGADRHTVTIGSSRMTCDIANSGNT
jgi:hypothetical protein